MTTMQRDHFNSDLRMFTVKDPISALTHLIGVIGAVIGMPMLLMRGAALGNSNAALVSYTVFMFSMIILYAASTSYHSFSINEKINKLLKKADHMSIFLLIAGSYTPIAIAAVGGMSGISMLMAVWSVALAGICFKAFWVTCPKWVSSVIYIGMGWICLFYMPQILASLSTGAFSWLLLGGIMYTVGGVIYAIKPKIFQYRIHGFGNHELFHCIVLAGSLCHFICIYSFITMIA